MTHDPQVKLCSLSIEHHYFSEVLSLKPNICSYHSGSFAAHIRLAALERFEASLAISSRKSEVAATLSIRDHALAVSSTKGSTARSYGTYLFWFISIQHARRNSHGNADRRIQR